MGTRSCEEITGAASWSLILLARPKLPLLRPPPQSPLGLTEATGVWKALMGSDLLNGPGLGPWDPNFSSDLLPFLERPPNTNTGLHALLQGLQGHLCRDADQLGVPERTEAPEDTGSSDDKDSAQQKS